MKYSKKKYSKKKLPLRDCKTENVKLLYFKMPLHHHQVKYAAINISKYSMKKY